MALVPENIIVLWPGDHGSIPTGWTRVTSYDGRFFKARVDGSAANAGATSHTHVAPSHTHTIPAHVHSFTSGTAAGHRVWNGSGITTAPGQTHTHTFNSGSCAGGTSAATTPTFACTTIEPPYAQMMAIKSDGTPTGFPDDSVVYYNNATAPTDWTDHAASREKFIKSPAACGNGIDNGSVSAAGGGSHVHAGAGHTHAAPSAHDHSDVTVTGTTSPSDGTFCGCDLYRDFSAHTHLATYNTAATGTLGSTTSANTAAQTYVPPYHVLLGIQNTSGADNWLEEAIVMFEGAVGDVPDDWTICDGSNNDSGNATPDLDAVYVRMAADGGSVGGTCGTAGHDHTDPAAHTHSQSHNHAFTNTYQPLAYTPGGNNQYRQHLSHNNIGHHYHGPTSASTDSTTTASCGTAQTVNATANTEPIHRTILYLSAPEEPKAGSVAMFGANF